jgi:hypothetical protein
MTKSTLISVNGRVLLYEYKGYRYQVDTRQKPLADQHRKYRDEINLKIQKERNKNNV